MSVLHYLKNGKPSPSADCLEARPGVHYSPLSFVVHDKWGVCVSMAAHNTVDRTTVVYVVPDAKRAFGEPSMVLVENYYRLFDLPSDIKKAVPNDLRRFPLEDPPMDDVPSMRKLVGIFLHVKRGLLDRIFLTGLSSEEMREIRESEAVATPATPMFIGRRGEA
jgi:hypothetical protein